MAFNLFSSRNKRPPVSLPPLIVVIDDEEDIRRLLSLSLERRGYRVAAASDGESGLALIREKVPALILLDMMMPVMNGFQMLAKMQKDAGLATIPVVVLSSIDADKSKTEAAWADSLQVARYIAKPLEAEAVADCVAEMVPIAPP